MPAHRQFPSVAGFTAWWSYWTRGEKNCLNYLINTSCRLHAGNCQWHKSQAESPENHLAMWRYVLSLTTRRPAALAALSLDQWKGGWTVFTYFCTAYWTHKQLFVLQTPSPAHTLVHAQPSLRTAYAPKMGCTLDSSTRVSFKHW